VNVGHNHPALRAALGGFLDECRPALVGVTSAPAGELAERLCDLAPGRMRRAFFGSSGTEAVEAAVKLAVAATGRTRIVHARGGYHGRTLGSLAVTSAGQHRQPWEGLLFAAVEVPFGDVDALRDAVTGAAAFVVEPVQGEGGVVLPPPGYLAAAAALCRAAGALLVVDEVQTGLGRTGRLFACEWDGVEPDVVCLAKSLSGGIVPIGVTLSTEEAWDAAYGSVSRSVLQATTFGGGGLAAAAGLATLDVLEREGLVARAEQVGSKLRRDLADALSGSDVVADVRGVGLMNAIELRGRYDGAAAALAEDVLSRLPVHLRALVDLAPDDVRAAVAGAGRAVEGVLDDALGLGLVAALRRRHRIVAFATANHRNVVRLQPPLVLGDADASRFVEAAAAACAELGTI